MHPPRHTVQTLLMAFAAADTDRNCSLRWNEFASTLRPSTAGGEHMVSAREHFAQQPLGRSHSYGVGACIAHSCGVGACLAHSCGDDACCMAHSCGVGACIAQVRRWFDLLTVDGGIDFRNYCVGCAFLLQQVVTWARAHFC